MIKDVPLPTEAEEYRNTAEILRDLAAQMRFGNTRNKLVTLAENLDLLATHAERRPPALGSSPSRLAGVLGISDGSQWALAQADQSSAPQLSRRCRSAAEHIPHLCQPR